MGMQAEYTGKRTQEQADFDISAARTQSIGQLKGTKMQNVDP